MPRPKDRLLAQAALGNLISAVLGALFFVGVYALIRRTGTRWWLWSGGLTAIAVSAFMLASPRGLPVVVFMVALIMALATPAMNTLNRIAESEADRHSLETLNLPDALATALVKTAEYRDPRPHPLQEFVFYTHPAVERRVLAAMRWKASGQNVSRPERRP